MITLDGSQGEGGGQILRTALTLSTCLGQPFHITHIRANRIRPGLQPQHLAAVSAAATVSQAKVEGAEKDSQTLVFQPGAVRPGKYHFDIGTAGSTSLVLQTILPALIFADSPSVIVLEGGTHNPFAPPFEFLKYAFLPQINKIGASVSATLQRPGFAPEGGGNMHISITPTSQPVPLAIKERGKLQQCRAEVLLANLPVHIAERELAVIHQGLSLPYDALRYSLDKSAKGAGNSLSIIVESEHITECFSSFGRKGLPAERVAEQAVNAVKQYLEADVSVGPYLADQLLLYLALVGKGCFTTMQPSLHTRTNITVIEHFHGFSIKTQQIGNDSWNIYC